MHNDPSYSYYLSGLKYPRRGITDQGTSDTVSMQFPVYCKPAQHNDRDWIRHVTAKAARRCFNDHGTGSQSVIGQNPA